MVRLNRFGKAVTITVYQDSGRTYLELHAMRAPVGHYITTGNSSIDQSVYDNAVETAVFLFESLNNIEVLQLGRSARHICIEDTSTNRRRYASLQRKAISATRAMWQAMREPGASEWPSGGI